MRPLTLSIAASCLLTACAAGTPPMPDPTEPIRTQPPPNLTAPPRRLPPAASGRTPDLEANHLQVTKAYHRLASQMCGLQAYLGIAHDECQAYRDVPPDPEP